MYKVTLVDNKFGTPVYRYRRIDDKTDDVRLMSVKVFVADAINPIIIDNVEAIDVSYDDDTNVFTTFKYLLTGLKQYKELSLINVVGYEILPEED